MYNYRAELKEDLEEWVSENIEAEKYYREEFLDELEASCWAEDMITGNGSGGKYFDFVEDAKKAVLENEALAIEAWNEFNCPSEKMFDWNYIDTTIRCYLFREVIEEIADDLNLKEYDGNEEE